MEEVAQAGPPKLELREIIFINYSNINILNILFQLNILDNTIIW